MVCDLGFRPANVLHRYYASYIFRTPLLWEDASVTIRHALQVAFSLLRGMVFAQWKMWAR
jgi:hypothetical protein